MDKIIIEAVRKNGSLRNRGHCSALLQVCSRTLAIMRDILNLHQYIEVSPTSLTHIAGFEKNPLATLPIEHSAQDEMLSRSSRLQLDALSLQLRDRTCSVTSSFEMSKLAPGRFANTSFIELISPLESKLAPGVGFDKMISLSEELVKYVIRQLVESCNTVLFTLEADIELLYQILRKPFVRISYEEALDIVKSEKYSPLDLNHVMSKQEKEQLVSYFYGGPVYVTTLPTDASLFIEKRLTSGEKALNFELLISGGETLAHGALLEESSEQLARQLAESNIFKQLEFLQIDPHKQFAPYLQTHNQAFPMPRGAISIALDKLLELFVSSDVDLRRTTVPPALMHEKCSSLKMIEIE